MSIVLYNRLFTHFCLCLEYTVLSLTSLGTKYAYFPALNSKLELQGSFDRNVETRDLISKLGSRPEKGLVDLFSALFLLTHFIYVFITFATIKGHSRHILCS